ncbi:type I-E CRISPR-associated protein Cse2/CasB [Microbacterium album]|uniref:Type I-E CRISPR-associated protein Cse2/CasB n=1 Tax=Microbacterium album TaxID=2053191 RepID=A0A917IHG5_9MICO|nr:type I-E CRISPR-associated protein Cse2/CasB [Microbacterium album]GGH51509.1 hypothetical protein GCM10010921_30970 [Microbacterium album]
MSVVPERAQLVEEHVVRRVRTLQSGYRRNASWAVAALAKLRRGVGVRPETDLELYGLALGNTVDDLVEDEERPRTLLDELRTRAEELTEEERAAFAAVTLYAMHQQSRSDTSMHRAAYGFGRSARLLGRRVDRDSVRRRFTALGTSATWDETVTHARGLIQQFRQHQIPLDYGRFARDLFDLQTAAADRVRMAWGRDFYRTHDPRDDAADASAAPEHTDNA